MPVTIRHSLVLQSKYIISWGRTCNPCGYTMKLSSRYHRFLNYDVKRTNKVEDMGPFKTSFVEQLSCTCSIRLLAISTTTKMTLVIRMTAIQLHDMSHFNQID